MKQEKFHLLSAAKFEAIPTIDLFDKMGVEFSYTEVGIGALAAAKTSSTLNLSNQDVIFIGSCGVFAEAISSSPNELKFVSTKKTIWSPPSVRSNQSELIEGIYPDITFTNMCSFSEKLDQYTVACTTAITIDETLVPDEKKCVENLELYSIAENLKSARSITIILGVTNKVWKNGREEWKSNFKLVAQQTAKLVEKKITE